MKQLLIIIGILCCLYGWSHAQQQLPTPIINTGSAPVPQATPIFPRGGRRAPQPADVGFGSAVGANTVSVPDGLALRQLIVQKYAAPLYRKPTSKEMTAIAPDPEMLKRYAAFLNQPKTGIFRLIADSGCVENSNVIDVREDCLKYTMPGAGNSYSFRTENYRIRHLADLTYSNGDLIVTGVLMHGILVRLGDLPLDVTPQTAGMGYLVTFEPSTDFTMAREMDDRMISGVESGGYMYKRTAEASVNSTYVLRAIAYDGKVMRSVRGAPYNEMDFDKRTDVTVAFRIVERSADGSITIIWKELSRTNSPKLKVPANSDKMASSEQPVMKYSHGTVSGASGAANRCVTSVAEITLCF